jgi:hypothetical protein
MACATSVPVGSNLTTMSKKQNFITQAAKLGDYILIGAGFLCLLTVAYFAYYYSWTGERQFRSWTGNLLYYVLPTLLALSLFASLRLKETFRINLALVSVSMVLSMYAGELFVWYQSTLPVDSGAELVRIAKQFGVTHYDLRSKGEVVFDLRQEGIDAVPAFIPLGLLKEQGDGSVKSVISIKGAEVLPLAGIANKVTVFCNESGEYLIYRSDEHGFHNPAGLWKSNRIDVAALGDSFTQGMCVPSDENFVEHIRKRYPTTLNLGMAGEGPLFMLAGLKEYLPSIRPKAVLWFYFEENDPIELKKEARTPLLMRYLERNFKQGLLARQSEIDEALTQYVANELAKGRPVRRKPVAKQSPGLTAVVEDVVKLGTLRQKLGLAFDRHVQLPEFTETTLELFRKILSEAKTTVAGWGGTLYFVYLPSWERYGDPDRASVDRDQVLRVVKDVGIPLIDINPVFQAHPDPVSLYPFRRWGHYNKEGHRVVGEAVLKSVASN